MNKCQRTHSMGSASKFAIIAVFAAFGSSVFSQTTQATQSSAKESAKELAKEGVMASSGLVGIIESIKPTQRDKALVYKQVLADGRILYADEPMKGQPVTKVIEVDLRSTSTWAAKTDMSKESPSLQPLVTETNKTDQSNQKSVEGYKTESSVVTRLLIAEERLARANEAVKNAETPLAGERSMNVNGTSRLNLTYFERQEKVKAQAHQAALEYYSALNASRNSR